MKLKILVQKLKESIAKKCTRVKELNKIISKHKYLFKKAAREKEQNETESEKKEQSKKRKECYVSLWKALYKIWKNINRYIGSFFLYRNGNNQKFQNVYVLEIRIENIPLRFVYSVSPYTTTHPKHMTICVPLLIQICLLLEH